MSRAVERFEEAARERGLQLDVRRFPAGTKTAPDAARAVGCDVGQIVKSLVFVADGEPIRGNSYLRERDMRSTLYRFSLLLPACLSWGLINIEDAGANVASISSFIVREQFVRQVDVGVYPVISVERIEEAAVQKRDFAMEVSVVIIFAIAFR